MAATGERPPPRFIKRIENNTVNVPFDFYTESGAKMTVDDLNNPEVQPYDKYGLEVILTKMRPNLYEVRKVENQNEIEDLEESNTLNNNTKVKTITNINTNTNLLEGPIKFKLKMPPRFGGGNGRKSRKQRKSNRRSRRKSNRSKRR